MERSVPIQSGASPKRLNWWLRLTSSGWDRPAVTLQDRELLRRSTLASWIILGMLGILVVISPAVLGTDLPSTIGILSIATATVMAAILNRYGQVTAAGWLLTSIILAALLFAITPEQRTPGGGLDLDALPDYDLMAVPVLISASLLRPRTGFLIAAANIVLMTLDFALQVRTPYLEAEMRNLYGGDFLGTIAMLARPAGLQVIVATVAYLWVRGVQRASVRADLAEQELALQQRYSSMEAQHLQAVQSFLDLLTTAIINLSKDIQTEVTLPRGHPFAQAAVFFNAQLLKLYRLKQERKQENPMVAAATNHLLVTLKRIAASQPGTRDWFDLLHPRQFETHVAAVDEMARQMFEILYMQLDYAYKHAPLNQT